MMQSDVISSSGERLRSSLAAAAETIDQAIDALLPSTGQPERRLVEAMRYASLGGGKRLRGFLVMEVSALLGGPASASVTVAASVEMLHAYSLVHDDLPAMDDDDMRRGQASTHRAFDEATAILAGDALQARSLEIIADLEGELDAETRCELVVALARAAGMQGMVGGQMVDMQTAGRTLSLGDVMRLQAMKTGRLIQYSAEAGAILARADRVTTALLVEYGRSLGAAFQIADDVLDTIGDTETLGKTTGKDQATGKATVVGVLGVQAAQEKALSLASHALSQLTSFDERADLLRSLTTYVVERRS